MHKFDISKSKIVWGKVITRNLFKSTVRRNCRLSFGGVEREISEVGDER
jgi:hypothetical protein